MLVAGMSPCQHSHIPVPALGKASSVQGAEGQPGAALGGLPAMQGGPAPGKAPLARAGPSLQQEPGAGSAAARPCRSLHGPGDIAPSSASPRGPPVLPSHAPCTAREAAGSTHPLLPVLGSLSASQSHPRVLEEEETFQQCLCSVGDSLTLH